MTIDFPTPPPADAPIGRCLDGWHAFLAGDREALAPIVADDAVLHSPVLYPPQPGKDLVVLYLTAASMSFVGDAGVPTDEGAASATFPHPSGAPWDGRFRYVRSVYGTHDAVLEFETVMAGRYVNGVDLIRCGDDGRIVDFKVMVRPAKAIDGVRSLMVAALDQLQGSGS